jgi:hypothetical protein
MPPPDGEGKAQVGLDLDILMAYPYGHRRDKSKDGVEIEF